MLATAFAGGLVAMQAPINSRLGKVDRQPARGRRSRSRSAWWRSSGSRWSSGGGFGQIGEVGDLSWYYLIGGLLGAVYVTTVLISVRTLGAGGVTAATIAGQLTMSVVLDQLGILGLAQRQASRRAG